MVIILVVNIVIRVSVVKDMVVSSLVSVYFVVVSGVIVSWCFYFCLVLVVVREVSEFIVMVVLYVVIDVMM